MGMDSPLAVLSERPQMLYDYFKQLFAQVTNPPIDGIREEIVTSSSILLGTSGNLLEPNQENTFSIFWSIRFDQPAIGGYPQPGQRKFKAVTISMLYPADGGCRALERALSDIFREADKAIEEGANI